MGWEQKVANVVERLAQTAYEQANPKDRRGNRPRAHCPYSLPEEVNDLVKCLEMPDRRAAEVKAKQIMEGMRRKGTEID